MSMQEVTFENIEQVRQFVHILEHANSKANNESVAKQVLALKESIAKYDEAMKKKNEPNVIDAGVAVVSMSTNAG